MGLAHCADKVHCELHGEDNVIGRGTAATGRFHSHVGSRAGINQITFVFGMLRCLSIGICYVWVRLQPCKSSSTPRPAEISSTATEAERMSNGKAEGLGTPHSVLQ
jgi:hypothetical protein